jgi:hypothetical protein
MMNTAQVRADFCAKHKLCGEDRYGEEGDRQKIYSMGDTQIRLGEMQVCGLSVSFLRIAF